MGPSATENGQGNGVGGGSGGVVNQGEKSRSDVGLGLGMEEKGEGMVSLLIRGTWPYLMVTPYTR